VLLQCKLYSTMSLIALYPKLSSPSLRLEKKAASSQNAVENEVNIICLFIVIDIDNSHKRRAFPFSSRTVICRVVDR